MIINSPKLIDKNTFNQKVLKNIEPKLNKVLNTYGHTVLYKFDQNTKEWDFTDTSGPLFILECYDGYKFLIINRKNPKNFTCDLQNLKIKFQEDFVLFKTQGKVYGLWFYDVKEGQDFIENIEKCKKIPLKSDLSYEDIFKFKKEEIHTLRDLQNVLINKIQDKEFLQKLYKKVKFE